MFGGDEAPHLGWYILRIFVHFVTKLEFLIDIVCLLCGAIFISTRPGIASMRAFRVLRLLWVHRIPAVLDTVNNLATFAYKYLSFSAARTLTFLAMQCLEFAEKSMLAIAGELFFLTSHAKGGFLLITIFLYTSFVMGSCFWQEFPEGAPEDNYPCRTMSSCQFTMLRLSLFDGTGFNYAYSLAASHRELFFIAMMYLCMTSFALVNGIVGVFAQKFEYASQFAFKQLHENIDVEEVSTGLRRIDSIPDDPRVAHNSYLNNQKFDVFKRKMYSAIEEKFESGRKDILRQMAATFNTVVIAVPPQEQQANQESSSSLIRNWKLFWDMKGHNLYNNIYFWLIYAGCILIEPFLVAHHARGANFVFQVIFIFVNLGLFIVMLFSNAEFSGDYIYSYISKNKSSGQLSVVNLKKRRDYPQKISAFFKVPTNSLAVYIYRIVHFFVMKLDVCIDFICLICGFAFIWTRPGIAAMRCFRVLRLFWVHKVPIIIQTSRVLFGVKNNEENDTSILSILRVQGFQCLYFCELALISMTAELFFLTKHARGGFLLITLLFYASYVMGTVFWIEFPEGNTNNAVQCNSLAACQYTMLRLTFQDGDGFDYAQSLAGPHKELFFVLMMYMFVTAFAMYNGILGIFSNAIQRASNAAFNSGIDDGFDDSMYNEDEGRLRRNSSIKTDVSMPSGKRKTVDEREFEAYSANFETRIYDLAGKYSAIMDEMKAEIQSLSISRSVSMPNIEVIYMSLPPLYTYLLYYTTLFIVIISP
jgi:hypothetical protein